MMNWLSDHSIVQFIGLSTRKSLTSCGYCKTIETNDDDSPESEDYDDPDEKKSVCLGLGSIRIYTGHINILLDRGWNWSGRYLYKPIMEKTCCPLYTIRLNALNFKLSRSQKNTLRTWNDFLRYDKRPDVRGDVTIHEHFSGPSNQTKTPKKGPTSPVPQKSRERKKKFIRRNKAIERLKEKGVDIESYQAERKLKEESKQRKLESYFLPYDETFKHRLEIRMVRVGSQEFKQSIDESFSVYEKYQKTVHQDKRCSRRGYQSFLVDNPFIPSETVLDDGLPQQGSYHMQFLIDDRIIAVGVVDVLPHCLSSAYFYYDPAYAFLNLGTYSALREIEFVRKLVEKRPECHFYYMGYYVHSCRKMRYKGQFKPSELLCEFSHQWVPLPECVDMIDKNDGNYTVFRPLEPPVQGGNVWECKPVKYNPSAVGGGTFEKTAMSHELSDQLSLFAKYFGDLCSEVYVII